MINLHMRARFSLFRGRLNVVYLSRSERTVLKCGVWLETHLLSVLNTSWMGTYQEARSRSVHKRLLQSKVTFASYDLMSQSLFSPYHWSMMLVSSPDAILERFQ